MLKPQYLLVSLFLALPAARAVELVSNGKAVSTVIVAPDAPELTRAAAREVADYLHKITGAEVAIRPTAAGDEMPNRIWVGPHPEMEARLDGKIPTLSHPEETVIQAMENDLVILGRDRFREGVQYEAGTSLAASSFIQDRLGVRWLWPGELGTDIPSHASVAFEPFVQRYHPQLRWRQLSAVNDARHLQAVGSKNPEVKPLLRHAPQKDALVREWLNRQKADHSASGDPASPLRGSLGLRIGHAYGDWWNRFHTTHPEYFALQPGGQRGGYPPAPKDVKICVSNPGVARQWIADAVNFIKTRPGQTTVSASENDRGWQGYCVCEACKAWDAPDAPFLERGLSWAGYSEPSSRALTDRYVRYWNRLARGLREALPERELHIGVMAYHPMRPAPVHETLEKNIVVAFVGIHRRNPINNGKAALAVQRALWQQWAQAADQLIWRPNLIHQTFGLPYVFPHRHSENMRFLADHKLVGISVDSIENHWATQGPQYYVTAQLAWNPRLDVDALLADYYARAFGAAAPHVAAYFSLFENLYAALPEQYADAGWHIRHDLPRLYRERWEDGERPDKTRRLGEEGVQRNDKLERAAAAHLKLARAAVADGPEIHRQRVAFVETGFTFVRAQLDAIEAMNDFRAAPTETNRQRAEAAAARRTAILEENIDSFAISYAQLLGRQLKLPETFGPPSALNEKQLRQLGAEKGE
ncbi:MAG TPA: DUF4838 domain-containing protein [Chthoniobacteraceae bacterium]|nr:DUF4838 domain-containing protein [Chthoniobacteraceae bacterium]